MSVISELLLLSLPAPVEHAPQSCTHCSAVSLQLCKASTALPHRDVTLFMLVAVNAFVSFVFVYLTR